MSRTRMLRLVAAPMLVVVASVVAVRVDCENLEWFVSHRNFQEFMASRWPPAARSLLVPALQLWRLGNDFVAALSVLTLGMGLAAVRGPFVAPGGRWPGRGRAAIAAAGLTLAFGLARAAIEAIADPGSPILSPANPHLLSDTLRNCQGLPPVAVLGAWSLLILAGRWRSRPVDDLEWFGRLLGWCWLASVALDLFREALG